MMPKHITRLKNKFVYKNYQINKQKLGKSIKNIRKRLKTREAVRKKEKENGLLRCVLFRQRF